MSNEDFTTRNGENEILSVDEQKLSDMLSSLKRINAPKNFDFRLKTRIANTRPEGLRPRRHFPMLGYAAPLAVVLLGGAYFAGIGIYSVDNGSVSSVQEVQPIADTSELSPVSSQANDETTPAVQDNKLHSGVREEKDLLVPASERDTVVPKKAPRPADQPGGSFDTGQRIPKIILPKGPPTGPAKKPETAATISVREILSTIGIGAEFDGESIKVTSVAANGMAARSGIAVGDVLETVNGQRVTGETMFESPFNVKSVGVARDGKSVQINLR